MATIQSINKNDLLNALRYGLSKDMLDIWGGNDKVDGGKSLEIFIGDDDENDSDYLAGDDSDDALYWE